MSEPLSPPPTPTAADRAAEVLISTAGEVPLAGPIVTALVQTFGTAYGHRLEAWRQRLYEAFEELRQRDLLDEATQRPEWITAVHDATRIALGEHLEAKLDMLKAVLVNAAARSDDRLADVLTLRYLRWVDEFEPEHVQVLRMASLEVVGTNVRSPKPGDQEVATAVLALPADQAGLIVQDLQQRGLIKGTKPARMVIEEMRAIGHGGARKQTRDEDYQATRGTAQITKRGRRFLEWVSDVDTNM